MVTSAVRPCAEATVIAYAWVRRPSAMSRTDSHASCSANLAAYDEATATM
ncbi:hypothetical protein [Streptomyces sp. NPDC048603]